MGEANLSIRVALLLVAMLVLALVEAWIPFRAPARRRERVVPNLALTLLFLALNLLLTVATAGQALAARVPTIWLVIGGVIALDGAAYLAHVLMHKVPALWRLHCVHHSDRDVDVTTAFRQHPLETLLRFAFTALPALALGLPPESVALYRLLSGVNALLEHANVRVPRSLERMFGLVFVTPPMHKVHHSCVQAQTDSNYSNIFSLFDRVFGTWRPPAQEASIVYGLDEFNSSDELSLRNLLELPRYFGAGISRPATSK